MRYSIIMLLAGLILLGPALAIVITNWGEPVALAALASGSFAYLPFMAGAMFPEAARAFFVDESHHPSGDD